MDKELRIVATFFLQYIKENDDFVVRYLSAENRKKVFGIIYGKCKKETQTKLSYDVSVRLFDKLINKIF